jgi:hypothetical protein
VSKSRAPALRAQPRARPKEDWSLSNRRVHQPRAGDPFAYASVAAEERLLARLEEKYAHEIMDDEERQELRDRVLALRWRLARGERRPPRAPGT